jgi:hypothetical protein
MECPQFWSHITWLSQYQIRWFLRKTKEIWLVVILSNSDTFNFKILVEQPKSDVFITKACNFSEKNSKSEKAQDFWNMFVRYLEYEVALQTFILKNWFWEKNCFFVLFSGTQEKINGRCFVNISKLLPFAFQQNFSRSRISLIYSFSRTNFCAMSLFRTFYVRSTARISIESDFSTK